MKKFIIAICSIFYILTAGCNFKQNTADKMNKLRDTLSNEDFDSFRTRFYSDSIFQMSRIIFPLESEKKIEREKKIEYEKASNSIEIHKDNYIPHDKNNWEILSDAYFKNDSIATIEGVKYKRRFYKTGNLVEENVLYADPEQVMIISKFKFINNKWFMVDFKDGFADE